MRKLFDMRAVNFADFLHVLTLTGLRFSFVLWFVWLGFCQTHLKPLKVKMSFDMDSSSLGSGAADKELQQFIQLEQQKAQLQSQIHKLTDVCWDQCFDKPRDKLDSRTENCMSNCVDRFIDVSLLVTQRFQQLLQRTGQ